MACFFEITVEHIGTSVLILPCGEIDLSAEGDLRRVVENLPACEAVVLDMSGVSFMDVAGLHFLLGLHHHARRTGAALLTIGWQRQPRHLLGLAAAGEAQPAELWGGPAEPHAAEASHVRAGVRARAALARLIGAARTAAPKPHRVTAKGERGSG